MVPQSAEEEEDFLLLPAMGCVAGVPAERGESAQCLRGSWLAESSSRASKSPRDRDDIVLQLVNAGLSSAALCNAGCSPSPAQD